VLPIVITVAAIVWLMHRSGVRSLAGDGVAPDEQSLMRIFGNADAFMSLVWGSLIGLAAAIVLIRSQRLLSWEQVRTAAAAGAAHMLPALAILWLASAMSIMTGNSQPESAPAAEAPGESEAPAEPPADHPYQSQRLYTGEFLGGLLENNVPSWLMPTLVFALAGAVAFATGTSWGTMGVLMPLTVGAVYRVLAAEGGPPGPDDPILLSSIGGVLAGAIFGDHCSPISDTTVLSSQACGCNHVEHVRTQLPYALLVGGMSVVAGTLPVALGAPVWLMLPLGLAGLAVVLAVAGKNSA
jgi:Na+/H+ antiporter NhaC